VRDALNKPRSSQCAIGKPADFSGEIGVERGCPHGGPAPLLEPDPLTLEEILRAWVAIDPDACLGSMPKGSSSR
jgi:hypothetical protein